MDVEDDAEHDHISEQKKFCKEKIKDDDLSITTDGKKISNNNDQEQCLPNIDMDQFRQSTIDSRSTHEHHEAEKNNVKRWRSQDENVGREVYVLNNEAGGYRLSGEESSIPLYHLGGSLTTSTRQYQHEMKDILVTDGTLREIAETALKEKTKCTVNFFKRDTHICNEGFLAIGHVTLQPTQGEEPEDASFSLPKNELGSFRTETEERIKVFTQDMIRTKAVDVILQKIEQGKAWVTVTGSPGEGKTTAGYLVLKQLKDEGREAFDVNSPEEYFRAKKAKHPVIMLNDIFGAFHFDFKKLLKWEEIICDALKLKEHMDVEYSQRSNEFDPKDEQRRGMKKQFSVMLISRLDILKSAAKHLDKLKSLVLSDDCLINMSNGQMLDSDDRQKIWCVHAGNMEVDAQIVERVCKNVGESMHGFPFCCRLYASLYKTNPGLNMEAFFAKPITFLNQRIESLLDDSVIGPLLRSMLRNDGIFDLNSVSDDEQRYQYATKVEPLIGTYLSRDANLISFLHNSIYVSVYDLEHKSDTYL